MRSTYTKTSRFGIDRVENAVLVYESALYAEQVPTIAISLIQSNPAFFPFEIEAMTGVRFAQLAHHDPPAVTERRRRISIGYRDSGARNSVSAFEDERTDGQAFRPYGRAGRARHGP